MMLATSGPSGALATIPWPVWLRRPAFVLAAVGFLALALSACAQGGGSSAQGQVPAGATSAALGEAPASPDDPGYTLGTGDRVRVTVFGHPDLSGEFEVGGGGAMSLPLIGDVEADGRSLGEVEKAIVEELSPQYLRNPKVALEVLSYRPFYILGEVNAPGSYPYVNGMRVVNAVALAGGYTYRAKESYVNITRTTAGQKQTIEAGPGDPVQPGDIIEVPERWF
jgi:polysaccharide export outer membrane protein